jgi:hypothetical protein
MKNRCIALVTGKKAFHFWGVPFSGKNYHQVTNAQELMGHL